MDSHELGQHGILLATENDQSNTPEPGACFLRQTKKLGQSPPEFLTGPVWWAAFRDPYLDYPFSRHQLSRRQDHPDQSPSHRSTQFKMSTAELASSYAALILADDGVEITVSATRRRQSRPRDGRRRCLDTDDDETTQY